MKSNMQQQSALLGGLIFLVLCVFSCQSLGRSITKHVVSRISVTASGTQLFRIATLLHASTQPAADPPLDEAVKEKIEAIINRSSVVLFMKGDKTMPQW
jgi:hypothetical protein